MLGYNRSVTKPHAVLPIDQPTSVSRARTSDKEEPRRKGISTIDQIVSFCALMLSNQIHDAGREEGVGWGGFSFTPWRHSTEQNKVWTSTNSLFGSRPCWVLLTSVDTTLISKSKERGEVYFLLQLQTLRWMIEGQWSQWVRVHWYFHSPEAL